MNHDLFTLFSSVANVPKVLYPLLVSVCSCETSWAQHHMCATMALKEIPEARVADLSGTNQLTILASTFPNN